MGLFQRLQDVTKASSDLLIKSNQNVVKALQKIDKPVPTYHADDLVTDVTQFSLGLLKVWLTFWKPLSDPVLPTVTITAPAATIPGGTYPTVTSLVFMGWSTLPAPGTDASQIPPLAMTSPLVAADIGPLGQDLTVHLAVPSTAPVPQQGIYQGFVQLGTAPLAVVVVIAL